VFLTTHYMEEASEADYVVILDSGKIVAEGTPHDLKDRYAGDFIKLYRADTAELDRLGIAYTLQNGYVQIAVTHTAQAREMIQQYPALFEDFEVVKGKMDDVFLAATGKELKEA
jgi:multidrug/hemolysin transport system ATP-binding protein